MRHITICCARDTISPVLDHRFIALRVHMIVEWQYDSELISGVRQLVMMTPPLLLLLLQEVEDELKRINHTLKPLDIVVVNTAAGMKYGQVGCHARGTLGLQQAPAF